MNRIEKSFKRLFFYTISVIVIILLLIATIVYTTDPYQQFRKSDNYINNARLEIAGVSKHHDYNAILLGSSMAMNHYPKQVDSLFSTESDVWRTKNFTLVGGKHDDYNVVLNRVFKDGKVKYIIFDLDYFSFAQTQNAIAEYLYEDNNLEKIKYIFNYTTLTDCIRKWRNPTSEDNLYHFCSPNGYQEVFDNYNKSRDKAFVQKDYQFDYEEMVRNFNSHFLYYIDKKPEICWFIYFPPYSLFEFIKYRGIGKWEAILRFKEYVIGKLLERPNVSMFDFQSESAWIMNYNEYMDVRHHSHKINRAIIQSIKEGKYKITKDNYSDKIDKLNTLVMYSNPDSIMKQYHYENSTRP